MPEQNAPLKRAVGRPRAFDRSLALQVALERFWRQGFEGVSTTQLCEAMGVNPPSLYAAFGSKEALFRECLASYVAQHGTFFSEALAADVPARQAMEDMLMGAVKQYLDPSHPPGCMVSTGGLQMGVEAVAEALAAQRGAAQQAIQQRLKRAQRCGELSATADAATLAAFFAMTLQGLAVQARDGAKPAALRRLAQLALQAWPG